MSESRDPTYEAQVGPIEADKRGRVVPVSNIRVLELALDVARNMVPFDTKGDFLFVGPDSTGTINVQLNNDAECSFQLQAQGGLRDMPMKRIIVTHAAQAGRVCRLYYGYRARFDAPSQAIATIGSITATVNTREQGLIYASAFKSNTNMAANTSENAFAPGSNVAGANVWRAGMWSFNSAGPAQGAIIGHTAAPNSNVVGDVLAVNDGGFAFTGTFAFMAKVERPIFLAIGKGTYFNAVTAETSCLRNLLYTL